MKTPGKRSPSKIVGDYIFPTILFNLILLSSCSLFEYHPYETNLRDENRNLNRKAIERIVTQTPRSDTLTIIVMGDTQGFYDEVEDFVRSANMHDADFVLLNGDITDFGVKDEFEWIHERMGNLAKPYVAVIGNHDLSGNGRTIYSEMYGPLNSSFIFNRIKFILMNSNSREFNFNGRVPDIGWLKSELTGDNFERAVVVSHVAPYDGDFDKNLEQAYATTLKESGKVNLSLHGHKHSFEEGEPYGDGVRYVVSTSMNEQMYLLLKLSGTGFTIEKIYY
jgi:3',5'-cyclic-AMP phosphodiesterase